ncbi:PREDICTED: probable LRR receptor-like serine/threonine-protein kinase At3g47570 [Erythranthe guttata]|uniref:probable LRR receptor-like serine/threonine-protein kinase At3g47570 n=1 Tax=Erythranthe guttata TaxID=4155 RepID=UPI00064E06E4|nr:PREDICTED: probable LRR receptor-like serine/threonine-protein kinase At3g47570 [Erythranthe guttata]|eukprot:XP_012829161.1 PREDICTED: probable LRR receptor-like serine/threonine-protein kinase At3g47570 [Erythranthe guttata]
MAKSIIIVSFFIIYSLALYSPATCFRSNLTDFLSLLALRSIDVDPNGALNSWNQMTSFCTWNGAACGRRYPNRVVAIKLDSQGLIGSLSSHKGNLSFLRVINLGNNMFNGRIPQVIGLLRGLEYIEFSNNSFMGTIMPENITQWKNLVYLNLIDNNLSGPIPSELRFLEKLEALGLSENKISGPIPHYIGNLTSVIRFSLRSCDFNGKIPDFPAFDFSGLHGSIPSTIGLTLPNLSFLSLGRNQFSGRVQISISNASSLESLVLSFNDFPGPMPIFGGLSRFSSLYDAETLVEDDFSFISSLTNCTNLRAFDLSSPFISGQIPESIGNITVNLAAIRISDTQLRGKIPSGIGNLVSLTYLYLVNHHLGSIPSQVGSLSSLVMLDFSNNRLSGLIPNSLATCISLERLYLEATGGFTETSLVGAGSFGYAYKGVLDDEVMVIAVKVLNLVVKGASKSFLAEYNALRGIRNIMKILSVCESIDFQGNDFKALVYEFKTNGSLDKWLYFNGEQEEESDAQLRNLDLIERLDIAIDVAHALEYLHSGSGLIIVHGDLKPSNILLDEDMTACVGDFGLSNIVSSVLPPQLGSRVQSAMSLKYGMSNVISTEKDVYSYGILVLEMFTNKRPTDDSFMDHVNLHNFVDSTLPDHVMEILDPQVQIGPRQNNNMFEDRMSCILNIGVSCSNEMPRDRISMSDVVSELSLFQKELSIAS